MKPVTPTKISKGSEIKVNLKKEINLEEVAEDLKKIINDLSKDTDIIKLGEELRNILLDIYTFINKLFNRKMFIIFSFKLIINIK